MGQLEEPQNDRPGSDTHLFLIPALPSMVKYLSKVFNISNPQFFHLENGANGI